MAGRGGPLLAGLGVALALASLLAAGVGQVNIPPDQVLGSLLHRLGLDLGPEPAAAQGENALWVVRFPRVALAVVTGAALACAGAVMQGVFGNPLAEPGVIGVSSGAAAVAPCAALGVAVERLRLVGIVVIALLTSAAVAFSGVIAFVGLVVPHLIRMVAGPGHRVLIPASALGGAVILVVADLVARTAVAYQELPLGVLTSLVGGPFFFWLLHRTRTRAGGWG